MRLSSLTVSPVRVVSASAAWSIASAFGTDASAFGADLEQLDVTSLNTARRSIDMAVIDAPAAECEAPAGRNDHCRAWIVSATPTTHEEDAMKAVLTAAALLAGLSTARADGTCMSNAAEKKLAGAAKTSFMGKCQKDAATSCDAAAAGKKLFGAAKTSFATKCVRDAVGG